MSQKPLIYAFVARGTVILSEYTEFSGNFNSIAFQCLQKLPSTNNKFTYNCDAHTFNYLVDNGFSMSFSATDLDSSLFLIPPIYCLDPEKTLRKFIFCLRKLGETEENDVSMLRVFDLWSAFYFWIFSFSLRLDSRLMFWPTTNWIGNFD